MISRGFATRMSLLMLGVLGAIGCNPDENVVPQSKAIRSIANVASRSRMRRAVTASQVLANEQPEFGGAFIDNGVVNVYITDAGLHSGVEGLLRASLHRMRPNLSVRVLRAEFSYRQLQDYSEALGPYYGSSGIAYTGIDDRTNRLHIGIVDSDARARVTKGIKNLSIDPNAVVLEPAHYVRLTTTKYLHDEVRPLWGGLELGYGTRGGTLGGIVQVAGVSYAITVSHLADTLFGGATGGTVYQNHSGASIGTFSVNPAAGTSGCPGGYSPCKFSDAALISLTETNLGFGKIARPGTSFTPCCSNGTLYFDNTNPIVLTSEGVECALGTGCSQAVPMIGDTASKIGAFSGWTGGTIAYIRNIASNGVWLLDSFLIDGADEGGDSGAPVLSADRTRLIGIAWGTSDGGVGGQFIVGTAIGEISYELTGSTYALHTIPVPILGYETHYRVDASCPNSPDSFDYVLVHGYPNGDGTYETRSTDYIGHSTYYCGNSYVNGNYASSSVWLSCPGGSCRDIWDAAGGSYTILPAL